MAEAATGVSKKDVELVRFLLSGCDGLDKIGKMVVTAAAGSFWLRKEPMNLVDKKNDLPISEAGLFAAAGNFGTER